MGKGKKTTYQPRRHLLQMHTTNYMHFIWETGVLLKKNYEPIRGRGAHPLSPLWIRHYTFINMEQRQRFNCIGCISIQHNGKFVYPSLYATKATKNLQW